MNPKKRAIVPSTRNLCVLPGLPAPILLIFFAIIDPSEHGLILSKTHAFGPPARGISSRLPSQYYKNHFEYERSRIAFSKSKDISSLHFFSFCDARGKSELRMQKKGMKFPFDFNRRKGSVSDDEIVTKQDISGAEGEIEMLLEKDESIEKATKVMKKNKKSMYNIGIQSFQKGKKVDRFGISNKKKSNHDNSSAIKSNPAIDHEVEDITGAGIAYSNRPTTGNNTMDITLEGEGATNITTSTISLGDNFIDSTNTSVDTKDFISIMKQKKQHPSAIQRNKTSQSYKMQDFYSSIINATVSAKEKKKGNNPKQKSSPTTSFLDSLSSSSLSSSASPSLPSPELSPKYLSSRRKATKTSSSEVKKLSNSSPLASINPNAPLTISDLEQFLNQGGYVRKEDLEFTTLKNTYSSELQERSPSSSKKVTKSGVAFPQPSILTYRDVQVGTAISSAFFFFLVSTSIQPNLWMVGSILGAFYGQSLAEKEHNQITIVGKNGDAVLPLPNPPGGLYGEVCLKLGRKISKLYLGAWDLFQGIWFMYRTGQLSYEYYKRYEMLDKKFAIQRKVDAWNSRFVEGKKNFDKWEQENEIGRKVLAGFRTVWLVEENSYKSQLYKRGKGKNQSKYRLVQYALEISAWFRKFLHAIWNIITGGSNSELQEIMNGIRIQISEFNLEVASQRAGSALAALVAVNIVGALFAVSPSILAFLAISMGIVWPNWVGATYQQIKDIVLETKARGKREKSNEITLPPKKKKNTGAIVDKNSFYYFLRDDGTKKWYRTGQSKFTKTNYNDDKGNGFLDNINWMNKKND